MFSLLFQHNRNTFDNYIYINLQLLFVFKRSYFFTFRERKEGRVRERETAMCQISRLVSSCTPQPGDLARNQACARTGSLTFGFTGWHSVHRPTPARARYACSMLPPPLRINSWVILLVGIHHLFLVI